MELYFLKEFSGVILNIMELYYIIIVNIFFKIMMVILGLLNVSCERVNVSYISSPYDSIQ